jgi:chaperonin GroES
VFVKAEEAEAKTVGGILLPSSAQKRPTQGTVQSAGGAKGVKEGDKVVYSKYAGTELELQGDAFVLLKVRHQGAGRFWSSSMPRAAKAAAG